VDQTSVQIVLEAGIGIYEEKKSKFIATIRSVSTEEEAQAFINEMKKKYWDARHNCMAYIIGEKNPIMRFSDDGEPSGTAGKPILEVLQGNHIADACIVVTRYFGGVLLGTGGLVRAYQKSSQDAIANSVIAEKIHGIRNKIVTDYNGFGKIQHLAMTESITLGEVEYSDVVSVTLFCEPEQYDGFYKKVVDITAGKAVFQEPEQIAFYKSANGITCI
jgi:uncharacterized YigZ family protein